MTKEWQALSHPNVVTTTSLEVSPTVGVAPAKACQMGALDLDVSSAPQEGEEEALQVQWKVKKVGMA